MNVVTVFVEGEGMLDAERESLRAHVREGVARFTRAWTEAHGNPGAVLAQVHAALRLGVAPANVARFVDAYDRWAQSEEHCGGPLFDAMLDAREGLPPSKVDPDAEPQAPLPGVDTSPTNDGAPDDFRAQAWGIVGDGGPYPGDVRTLAIMAGKLDHAMELLVLVHEVVFNPGDVLDPVAVIARVREAARAIRAGRAMQGGSDEVAPIPAPWQR